MIIKHIRSIYPLSFCFYQFYKIGVENIISLAQWRTISQNIQALKELTCTLTQINIKLAIFERINLIICIKLYYHHSPRFFLLEKIWKYSSSTSFQTPHCIQSVENYRDEMNSKKLYSIVISIFMSLT
jgi:hypothetical protein